MKTVGDRLLGALAVKRAAMADAICIGGIRVSNVGDVDPQIADAPANDGSAFIYAMAARAKVATPPLITVETAKGLSLQMVKA